MRYWSVCVVRLPTRFVTENAHHVIDEWLCRSFTSKRLRSVSVLSHTKSGMCLLAFRRLSLYSAAETNTFKTKRKHVRSLLFCGTLICSCYKVLARFTPSALRAMPFVIVRSTSMTRAVLTWNAVLSPTTTSLCLAERRCVFDLLSWSNLMLSVCSALHLESRRQYNAGQNIRSATSEREITALARVSWNSCVLRWKRVEL